MTAMDTAAGGREVLRIEDDRRVRLITFDRPAVLNAFDTALYTAAAEALGTDDADPTVSAFPRFVDALQSFPKPLLAAVNGLGSPRSPRRAGARDAAFAELLGAGHNRDALDAYSDR